MTGVVTQTLHIVARELNNELNDARVALENFGEQQDDVRYLEGCRDRLHHVYGALRVSEVYGAALLAEEMEQVAKYLIDNFAEKRHLAEGLDALMRSMVQLPTYLERVLGGGRDMALILLPLLNDLRAVRGHALLSEGTLLLLNLSSEQQAHPQAPVPGEVVLPVANWARKLRTKFQLGLLGWIKGERVEQNLDTLLRSAEKLEQVATAQSVFQLWWVVSAVIEALRDGGLEGSASIKRLLGQADREMKRLYELGEQRYAERPPVELLNNLLYYVARTHTVGPKVAAVRASFRLGELLPVDAQVEAARESLAAPSVKLMKTVAAAIKEDLARVKDAFDIFVRQSSESGGNMPSVQLAPQLELLRKIGDTLGVLGLGELRDRVQAEITELQAVIERQAPLGEARLMHIASTLINIEDSLDEQLVGLILPSGESQSDAVKPDVEFRQVTEAVLRECIVNMARIKEAIALSVEKPREPQVLDQVPQLIRGIVAGLLMLGKTRAVEITESIGKALSRFIRPDGTVAEREALDRMADAIVAVEYYLETLHAGRADPWYMLDNAEACLQALSEIATGGLTGMHALRDLGIGDHGETMAAEHTPTIALERGEKTQVMSTVQQVTQVIPTQAKQQHASRGTPPNVPLVNVSGSPGSPPVLAPPPDKADPEFVELFIEEARDEIAKLETLFPRWDENPQDNDALVNMRRSFHTLKGSGRMVGAMAIGELAWAVEGMLNRVINRTLDRSPDMMAMLRSAVAAVPELVEQLESGRAPKADVAALIATANRLAQVREVSSQELPETKESKRAAPTATVPSTPSKPVGMEPTLVIPPAQSPAPAAKRAPASNDTAPTMDAALREIFSKETTGHLGAIRDYINSCGLLTPPYPVTETLHRACHTLSGTAKTAGARQGIKIAEPLNHYVRKLYDNGVGLPPAGLQVLKDSVRAVENVVEHINESTGYFVTHQSIVERIGKLEQQLDLELTQMSIVSDSTAITPLPALREPPTMSVGEDVIELSFDAAQENRELGLDSPTRISKALSDTNIAKQAALPRSSGETMEVMIDPTVMHEMSRAFTPEHTQRLHPTPPPEIVVETAPWAANYVPQSLPAATERPAREPITLHDSPTMNTAIQPALRNVELRDIEMTALEQLPESELMAAFVDDEADTRVQPAMPAMPAMNESSIELSGELHGEEVQIDMPSTLDAELSDAAVEIVLDTDESQTQEVAVPEVEAMVRASDAPTASVVEMSVVPDIANLHPRAESKPAAPPPASIAPQESVVEIEEDDGEYDPDVAAIFTEEAAELLDVADAALASWSRDRANQALIFELKRALHTLKGGARMAGIRAMGDLSHEFETFVEGVESHRIPVNDEVIGVLQAGLDELHRMRDVVSQGNRVKQARDLIRRIHVLAGIVPAAPAPVSTPAPPPPAVKAPPVQAALPASPEIEPPTVSIMDIRPHLEADRKHTEEVSFELHTDELKTEQPINTAIDVVESGPEFAQAFTAPPAEPAVFVDVPLEQPKPIPPGAIHDDAEVIEIEDADKEEAAVPAILPPGREQVREERQEVARVDAELLDMLLNNAGEVSILRSRIEQQVNSVEFNLAELNRTVTRLKEQLRNMEIETEAQILHRHHEEKAKHGDFDPLEMDRYSQIQQLSRALAESVSDVASIEGLLESLTREAQNLLLQQSRVVTEVQNGLMRTRMVPFQRHVQRLSRIVRQVAGETGKRAELAVTGASGELDRQVLERMLPPFEHMLRNSVVHGLETPAERRAAGKPESGTIRIGLHREGSEMVIVVEDDGRGIDVKAVRERAMAKGLLKAGRTITDEEALQLILEPGFSTASSITQHAGRGVGMDVVVAEIKKLGGALFTQSTPGHGARFTIRLPFTLAIAQSLLVRVGEEQYALPLPTVEGVARIPRAEVLMHLRSDQPSFNYGTQLYRIQQLGAFIGAPAATLPDADVPVPVILIRAGEHSTGLVVDELLGNREIVVKPVGPQVAGIRGVSGATILGDGRIVIILDMGALVRSEWRVRNAVSAPTEDRRTFALVVDDSITVRRVTQRLLERNGMRVLTAKDGVDALEILQDHQPDIILLDIEMPRMDGYELATRVRADARLADIPIVMITSRVGEKHRSRAIEIGVNDYLGKPYQENQLLDAIEPLVDAYRRRAAASLSKAVH
jgi:chemosensory pili system protein ChpA (sensor histidine kinase/response regulator)